MTVMYGHWFGGGWMLLMPLLWIVLIGAIAWAVIRLAVDRSGDRPKRETPQEILDRRFASGEIDADTYSAARDRLVGKQPRSS